MSDLLIITNESEEAVVAATRETVLQVRGVTTIRTELAYAKATADYATDATKFVLVSCEYQSTDGTATGTTEVPADPMDPTTVMTGFRAFTSTMPTAGSFIDFESFNANGGKYQEYWAEGDGAVIDDATTSRIAITVTADANCNIAAVMKFRIRAA